MNGNKLSRKEKNSSKKKINEGKSCLFGKIIKINKPLARLEKKRQETLPI